MRVVHDWLIEFIRIKIQQEHTQNTNMYLTTGEKTKKQDRNTAENYPRIAQKSQ